MSIYIDEFKKIYGSSCNLDNLRTRILNLGVSGKLLTHDELKGNSDDLISKIIIEKNRLVKDKLDKKLRESDDYDYEYLEIKLPSGWRWKRLGDIALLIMGQSPDGISINDNSDNGVEFHQGKTYFGVNMLRNSNKFTNSPKKIAPKDSILISVRAPVGTVNFTDRRVCIGRGLSSIVPLLDFDNEFLFYSIRAYEEWLNKYATGTTFKAISGETLGNLMIPVPPVNEQKMIVARINMLLSQIDKLEMKIRKKEQILQCLPEAMVGVIGSAKTGDELKLQLELVVSNFETIFQTSDSMNDLRNVILQLAIEGKLVQQNPNEEPANELIKRDKIHREKLIKEKIIKKPKELMPIEDDEFPFEIPNNWEWSRMGDIGYSYIGLTYKPSNVVGKGLPVLRSNNIQNGKINYDNFIYVNIDPKKEIYVQCDDVLICARNGSKRLVGKSALIDENSAGMTFGAFMTIYRSKYNRYIYHFLNSKFFRNQLSDSNTTTVNQITQGMLRNILIPLPPIEEQRRIIQRVESLMGIVDVMEEELKKKQRLVGLLGNL